MTDVTGLPEIGDDEGWKRWYKAFKRGYYKREWDIAHREENNLKRNAWRSEKRKKRLSEEKPFIGVDGEGAGEGLDHIYWLLRVGDKALYNEDGNLLNTTKILKWLADLGEEGLNDRCIPVAYFFNYDISMILRYLPDKNLRELFWQPDECLKRSCKHKRSEHWKNYGSCFLENCNCKKFQAGGQTTVFLDNDLPDVDKKNCIQIQVRHQQLKVRWWRKPFLTITDVSEFFQTSFLKTLDKWQIATPEEYERIKVNKERRAYFEYGFDQETFDYNTLECELLAKLMEEFRRVCFESGLHPDMWTGPGRLAECVFEMEGVPQRSELDIPPMIENLCNYAYYGGRTEGILFGETDNILALDIASAYPAAYRQLPCLVKGHGKWERVPFEEVQEANLEHTLVVGKISCNDKVGQPHPKICGLPMRDKTGNICFPTFANGCWWYPEVRETLNLYVKERIKHTVQIEACFTWRQSCNELPGSFTERWYRKRLALGKSTRGIPTKLCLNSLYGKAAQRVGTPKWANGVWAGLLTAYTRARLLEVTTTLGSSNIISFQTDGIFACSKPAVRKALERLSIWEGEPDKPELGSWELEHYDSIFLIQSGVYSVTKHDEEGMEKVTNKTRGMRDFEFEAALPEIRKQWETRRWFGEFNLPDRTAFVTSQLGLLWNQTNVIGCWVTQTKRLAFYSNCNKRELWYANEHVESNYTNGETFAPGRLHALMVKREYGDHPLMPEAYSNPKYANEPKLKFIKGLMFSIPYSQKLQKELWQKMKEQQETWQYHTPDEPYILPEG